MTRCQDEKSASGQGGGIGNRKPMSANDSSDAPARSSDSRTKARKRGVLQPQICLDRRPGRISRAEGPGW
jgi:hypothetical protein